MGTKLKKKYSISDELKARTFDFAISILELAALLPNSDEARVVRRQLCKSGTSVGANIEEADGSLTLNDFVYRVDVAFKEVKETRYWLRVITSRKLVDLDILRPHLDESLELTKILSTIIFKCLK
ncbi:four helix bundle protein [candidate division WOR-3 bacterium]|nr:four helix bundle protein [candidate division WOR-3 bacterium]